MVEIASVLAAYFAFALLHAAVPERGPWGLVTRLRPESAERDLSSPPCVACMAYVAYVDRASASIRRTVVRGVAVVFFSLSVGLWGRAEAGPAALLVAFTALMVSASAFVLLAPVCPRIAWGLAILCPPAIVVLSFLGA